MFTDTKYLFVLFLLIFGPRLGGYGSLIDTVSITSAILVVHVLLTLGRSNPVIAAIQSPLAYWCGGLLMYCITIYLFRANAELLYITRYLRTTLQLFGCLALFSLLLRAYGDDISNKAPRLIMWAIAIHGTIMIGMYISPRLREVIWSLTEPDFQRAKRVGGLVGALDSLSAVQGFGLVLSVIYWPIGKSIAKAGLYGLASVASLLSIIISGRTGVVLAASVLLAWSLMRAENTRRVIAWSVLLASIIVAIFFFVAVEPDVEKRFTGQVDRLMVLLKGQDSDSTRATARQKLQNDYRFGWPKEPSVFLFGNSRSGRTERYRLPYDPGWILDMHGIGLVGTLFCMAFYAFSIRTFIHVWRVDQSLGSSGVFWTLFVLATHSKVQFALSRLSLTISAMLLFSSIFLLMRERRDRVTMPLAPSSEDITLPKPGRIGGE